MVLRFRNDQLVVFPVSIRMASVSSLRCAPGLRSQMRRFSTTISREAADVKKLGVVGAGQMVSARTKNSKTKQIQVFC